MLFLGCTGSALFKKGHIVQSIFLTVCDCYCVFYCMYRRFGYNIMEIANMFTSDNDFNDEIFVDFTYNMAVCV